MKRDPRRNAIGIGVFLCVERERKRERKKKENVFERNEILDLLRNKKGGNDYVIFELSQSSNSSHVFPCLMKEEISVLFDET